jgi:hypothetical protein
MLDSGFHAFAVRTDAGLLVAKAAGEELQRRVAESAIQDVTLPGA